jgi:hypothetical protein
MSLSLLEVVAAVRARRASLSAETVGYLLLGVADHVIAVPREIGACDVLLGAEGAVRLGSGKPGTADRPERALRELLDALLSVASTATPALLRIGRRQTAVGVDALVRELEAALIPVNRAAARRALTRLYRDTQRATQAGPLDVGSAQAWLQRAMIPSAPVPAVVPEPSIAVVETILEHVAPPSAAPAPASELPVEVFETLEPSSLAITRPPPVIEERPVFETLTRPEPVLVRAAARARADVREQEVDPLPPFVGTPPLGTFAARSVLPPLTMPGESALLLDLDEATDRMPEVAAEPLVRTAPLLDVVTAPVASDELSEELASFVADAVSEAFEPSNHAVPSAAPETVQAPAFDPDRQDLDGDFDLEDEILIVVDEDLEAFEPELASAPVLTEPLAAAEIPPVPVPLPEPEPASAEQSELLESELLEFPVTRWWSSPEPPAPTESAPIDPEPFESVVHDVPPAAIDAKGEFQLPVVPELELPPLPEFVAWPTPQPPVQVESLAEASGSALKAEVEPEVEAEEPAAEIDPRDEADFEAAAAEYAAAIDERLGEAESVAFADASALVERRILPLREVTDFAEVGWTPAPEPQEAAVPAAALAPTPAQAAEPPQAPEPERPSEPTPEPAPPRFAPRKSDVSDLLRGFAVTEARSERELCRDLKALAGVDLTPPPPGSGALR